MEAICAIVEEVSAACASTGAILAAHALGAVPLLLAGTPDQQRLALGGLLAGHAVSFALTEVGAGSDAGAIRTTAVADGDGYRLDGEKVYVGNGGAARHYVVFAGRPAPPPAPARSAPSSSTATATASPSTASRTRWASAARATSNAAEAAPASPAGALLGERGRGLKLALRTLDLRRVSVAAQGSGSRSPPTGWRPRGGPPPE